MDIVDQYIKHKEQFRTLSLGEDILPYDVYVDDYGAILCHSGPIDKPLGKVTQYSYQYYRLFKDNE